MNAIRLTLCSLLLTACQDERARPTEPLPPSTQNGVQAFVTMDNLNAQPGQTVRVRVEVQVGAAQTYRVGSYTGRLRFDPARLAFRTENAINNDGLRIANPANAPRGEIRFAGAAPLGFQNLVLYEGTFEVRQPGYAQAVQLVMEELSAARSLANLRPQLRVNNQVFLRPQANR